MTAGILAELERQGLRVRLAGDKIAVSPKGAITDEVRQIIRNHRQEIISVLKEAAQKLPEQTPRVTDPASPWPTGLPGYGSRTLGPLTYCLLCRAATWVRYGFLPVCLACARKSPGPPDPKARLWRLLDEWASPDEATNTQETVDRLKDKILDMFRDQPEADQWFREWRRTHPEAKLV
jgi:hypothetical protein